MVSWLVLAGMALAGCSHASDNSVVSRRVRGDSTFVTSPLNGIAGSASLVPARWIGGPALDLGQLQGGAFGPNGTIWLYDAKGRNGEALLVLHSTGALLTQAGHPGRGPGEYHGSARIFALADGTMLLREIGTDRAIRYAADGSTLATYTLPTPVINGWVVTPDTAGGWYLAASFEDNTPTRVGRFGWMHFDRSGVVTDTVLAPERFWSEPTPDGIAPGRIRTVGRDGAVLTAVPGPNRLDRILPGGQVIVMQWPGEPPRYGDAERHDIQAVEDWMNKALGKPLATLPDRKAPVRLIQTDLTGMIWAMLADTGVRIPDTEFPKNQGMPPMKWLDGERWGAFSPDGVLQFTVAMPEGGHLLDRRGTTLLGTVEDENGVPSVLVWEVRRKT